MNVSAYTFDQIKMSSLEKSWFLYKKNYLIDPNIEPYWTLFPISPGNQWSFINNSLQSQNPSRSAKGSNSSLDRLYSRKIRKQLVHHKQVHVSRTNFLCHL